LKIDPMSLFRTVSRIVCIGGANIDIRAKAAGQLRAHASNPGIVSIAHGGVARNVAQGLARLGLDVAFISTVGGDDFGRDLLKGLDDAGVDTSMARIVAGGKTGSYVAILDGGGELSCAINAMEIVSGLTPEAIRGCKDKLLAAHFLFADCNLPAETLRWLADLGPPLIIDPVSPAKAVRLRELTQRNVFAITPNRYQVEALLDMGIADLTDANIAASRLQAMGFHHVMLSLGAEGVVAATEDETVHFAAEKPAGPVRDVTGAGDAAIAGLIFGLCAGRPFAQSCRMGQKAAAHIISGGQLSREHVA
jgi:pseudouridine kinase